MSKMHKGRKQEETQQKKIPHHHPVLGAVITEQQLTSINTKDTIQSVHRLPVWHSWARK